MLKNLMSKTLKVFTIVSSSTSVLGFALALQDFKLKDKFIKLQERNELLERQVNEIKLDELKNEITKDKVEYYRNSLEESHTKLLKESEAIQSLEVKTNEQKDIMNSQLENFNTESDNMQNMVSEIIKFLNDNSNKFLVDINIFEKLTNYINNLNKFLATLSFEQYYAVAHLSSAVCILVFLFSIISILFGDQLINYFKLEKRFPKLSILFKIRSKLNNLSLFISFTVIIFNLLAIIYINLFVLINF